MKRYNLGPLKGGILTSLNLFTTKFDQVVQRAGSVESVKCFHHCCSGNSIDLGHQSTVMLPKVPHVLNPDVMRTRADTTFSFIDDYEIWVSLTFLFNIRLPWSSWQQLQWRTPCFTLRLRNASSILIWAVTNGWNRRHLIFLFVTPFSPHGTLKGQTWRDSTWDWARHRLLPILIYPPTCHTTNPGQFRYNRLHRVASHCAASIPWTTFSYATEYSICCISLHYFSAFHVDLVQWRQRSNDSSPSGYQIRNHPNVWMELGQHRGGMHKFHWPYRLRFRSRWDWNSPISQLETSDVTSLSEPSTRTHHWLRMVDRLSTRFLHFDVQARQSFSIPKVSLPHFS